MVDMVKLTERVPATNLRVQATVTLDKGYRARAKTPLPMMLSFHYMIWY